MYGSIELSARTPWTADFVAAKGRAVIFAVLVLIFLAASARAVYVEQMYIPIVGRLGYENGSPVVVARTYPSSMSRHRTPWYAIIPYTLPPRQFALPPTFSYFGSNPPSGPVVFINPWNPQDAFIAVTLMPSGFLFIMAAVSGVASLYCFVVHKAGRKKTNPHFVGRIYRGSQRTATPTKTIGP